MSRTLHLARGAALVAATALAIGCSTKEPVGPGSSLASSLFTSYVALGNSITSGYQSGGINDSTQQQSYAVLMAKQMGTRFAYPSVNGGDGCRLTVNFVTGAQNTTPPVGTPCARNAFSVTDILNSVAVPGAASADPTSLSTPQSNGLTTLFLGGQTQVQRALEAQPTFASIWIGNNDILPYAVGGIPIAATPQATFVANYDLMMSQLLAGAPNLQGVLIGVVNVQNAPVLFTSAALFIPGFLPGLSQAAGKTITTDKTCTGTDGSLISLQIVTDIRSGKLPPVISCTADSPLVQDDVLTLSEQAEVSAIVTGYNTFIAAKADSIGWAFFDPNPILVSLKNQGLIPPVPNLASATAPFGTYVTLDGVHPSRASHVLIANGLIDAINAKFGTTLAHTQ
jgi:hypothetical protein